MGSSRNTTDMKSLSREIESEKMKSDGLSWLADIIGIIVIAVGVITSIVIFFTSGTPTPDTLKLFKLICTILAFIVPIIIIFFISNKKRIIHLLGLLSPIFISLFYFMLIYFKANASIRSVGSICVLSSSVLGLSVFALRQKSELKLLLEKITTSNNNNLHCLDYRLDLSCNSCRSCQPITLNIDSKNELCPAKIFENVTTQDYSKAFTAMLYQEIDPPQKWKSFLNRICDIRFYHSEETTAKNAKQIEAPAVFVVCAFSPIEIMKRIYDRAKEDKIHKSDTRVKEISRLNWINGPIITTENYEDAINLVVDVGKIFYNHFKAIPDSAESAISIAENVAEEKWKEVNKGLMSSDLTKENLESFLKSVVMQRIVRVLLVNDFPPESEKHNLDLTMRAGLQCLKLLTFPANLYLASKRGILDRKQKKADMLPMSDFALIFAETSTGRKPYAFDFYDDSNILVTSGRKCDDAKSTNPSYFRKTRYEEFYLDWLENHDITPQSYMLIDDFLRKSI